MTPKSIQATSPGHVVPPELEQPARAQAEQWLAALKETLGKQDQKKLTRQFPDAVLIDHLVYLQCCSEFVTNALQHDPDFLSRLLLSGLHLPREPVDYHDSVATLAGFTLKENAAADPLEQEAFMGSLREWRRFEMVRIAWRDLTGLSDTLQTLEELSALADASLMIAERYSRNQLSQRFGLPCCENGEEQPLVILAMGKLGGRELNFSSDIDLVMTYPEGGETRARSQVKPIEKQAAKRGKKSPVDEPAIRSVSNEEFFHKQVQLIVKLLGQVTAGGFVFRVDLRLRPYGSSGPLALSFDALENYYLLQGREWERYAMIKARPVTGPEESRQALLALLRPFVYRRYLDYSVFASLRELKHAIANELEKKGETMNIKTGLGGIREIEFIGQAFQLLRGGREPELQIREILLVLQQLKENKLLPAEDVVQLETSYLFLRKLENRLQMYRDEQEHSVPSDPELCLRIALSMGYSEFDELQALLETHRSKVNELFSTLFNFTTELSDGEALELQSGNELSAKLDSPDELTQWFKGEGYADPARLVEAVSSFRGSGFYANLSETARNRVEQLLPQLMQAASRQPQDDVESEQAQGANEMRDQTLLRMLELVRAVAGRSGYLQILVERPAALDLLAGLFCRSSWLAGFVTRHPIVIDELLDEQRLQALPDSQELGAQATQILERLKDQDLEMQMDALRQFKLGNTTRAAVSQLQGLADNEEVSRQLTRIAEAALNASSQLVQVRLHEQYGKPHFKKAKQKQPVQSEFAIVAYGKLGSGEMGFGSDLDIVFLHDSEGDDQQTDGERVLENSRYFARAAQKIVHFITTLTPAGALYQIDARLRPNGRAGMLVSSLQSFESYQHEQAWVWEHQALVRARVVVGSESFSERFERVRSSVLSAERDPAETAKAIAEMRTRMASELDQKSGDRFDLKQGRGGLVDIEFIVQYLVLTGANQNPEMLASRDALSLLQRSAALGLLPQPEADSLSEACRMWHDQVHQAALQETSAVVATNPDIERHRGKVTAVWDRILPKY